MNAVAAPFGRLRERAAVVPAWLVATLGLAALVGLSAWLRTQAMLSKFWIDEGLTVGIADHPLREIPSVLRLDGAPPLYYMLLHVWMGIRGMGEGDTHALSLGFALLCVPAAWVAAKLLWGTREAWFAAIVAALVPYLTYYAQETRMYALVVLLSLVVTASFALAFVQRRRRAIPVLSVSVLLAVYTHNWALFLGAACIVAFLVLLWRSDDRRALLRDGLLAAVPVALLYAPWVPTLLFQAGHTAAPWSQRPDLADVLNGLKLVLGREGPSIAVLLGAGAGWWALAVRRRRLGPDALAARSLAAIAGVGLLTLAFAYVASQIEPAWANRYFAVIVGPTILVVGAGFARGGRLGVVALVLVSLLWLDDRSGELRSKSNAFRVAAAYTARLEPGDQVVVTHPEQSGVMWYYLPEGLRWADPLGRVSDPRVFDWRDALTRLEAAEPAAVAEPLVRDLRPGQRLLLVQPLLRGQRWGAPWTALVRERVVQWEDLLDRDPRLRRVDSKPQFGLRYPPRGLRGVLYVRR